MRRRRESLKAEAIGARMIGDAQKAGSESLEERIANLFLTVGIPAHIKGYQFLREAVRMVIENPELIIDIRIAGNRAPLWHHVQQGGAGDPPRHRGGMEPRPHRSAG